MLGVLRLQAGLFLARHFLKTFFMSIDQEEKQYSLMKKMLLAFFIILLVLGAFAQVKLYQYKGEVQKPVTDGDTFTVHVSLGFDVYKDVVIRLASINAPEMTGPDSVAAKKAKAYLQKRVGGKTVYFTSKQYDKYHRSIAIVYLSPTDTATVNWEMVRKGYAKSVKY